MHFENNEPNIPASHEKIKQYIARVREGESLDALQLPPMMRRAVEEGLKNVVSENLTEEDQDTKSPNQKIEELYNRIERYPISLPNLDSIIKNGGGHLEVVVNGEKIDFDTFEILIGPRVHTTQQEAVVGFIKKKNRTKNPGIGLPIYLELGKQLAQRGIVLSSSDAQYSHGRSIWMNLARLGYASKLGRSLHFTIPEKESILREGTLVEYEGRKWKIKEVSQTLYENTEGIKKNHITYNLERDDGLILQRGGVKRFITREDFKLVNS